MISNDSVVSGPVVAQPERQQRAGQRREQRRQHARQRAVDHDAVADRLGAELVLADRLQHAAERRVDDAQQRQDQHQRSDEEQVVGDEAAVDRDAEERLVDELRSRATAPRARLKVRPSSPPVKSDSCEASVWNADGDRERDHREEDRAHAQAEQADHAAPARSDSASARGDAERDARPAGPMRVAARSPRRRRRCRRTSCARS